MSGFKLNDTGISGRGEVPDGVPRHVKRATRDEAALNRKRRNCSLLSRNELSQKNCRAVVQGRKCL